MRKRALAKCVALLGLGLWVGARPAAAADFGEALAIGGEPAGALSGSHQDAVILPDGSVVPDTGSTLPNGTARRREAEALFEQALTLEGEGRMAEACAKFEASEALDIGVGTLLHLADCYERVGRLASAWRAFREAETLARAFGMQGRQEIAIARAAALDPKLSRIVIVVPQASEISGLTIRLGENRLSQANWGSSLPLDPGHYTVQAEAHGFRTARVNFEVPDDGGHRFRVVVPKLEPLALPAAEPQPAPATPDSSSGYRTAALVSGASGIITLGAAGIFAALAAEKNEESLDHCPAQPNLCSASGVRLRNEAAAYADVATVGAAVGGALLVTGFVLYAAAPKPAKRREPSTLNIAPTLTSGGAGLRFGGRF